MSTPRCWAPAQRAAATAWARACLALGCVLLLAGAPSRAQTGTDPTPQQLDSLRRLGESWPERGAAALQALPRAATPAGRRALALTQAELAARTASDAALAPLREAALQAAAALDPLLAQADGALLDALRVERLGAPGLDRLATQALALYARVCGATPDRPPPDSCETRTRWRLLQMRAMRAANQRDIDQGRETLQQALALARQLDDPWRLAATQGQLALAAAGAGERDAAAQHLTLAQGQAGRVGLPDLTGRVLLAQAQVALTLGDLPVAAQALAHALTQARAAQAIRLEATVLGNDADLAIRQHQPQRALQQAEAGLHLAQRLGDARMARMLRHNAMLAKVALGRSADAQQDLDALQQAWAAEGNTGVQVSALREFADALADAGDAAGAVAVHHRERALTRQLGEANRAAALGELRGRYDREAQQRDIQLLASETAVQNAELTQRTLARRLWLLGGGALGLALVLTALLVLRVRETNRQLEHSRARLRLQSERDALTGLANRRHFQAVLQTATAAAPDAGLQGALLMLDIDHFKQINDSHGHAAGDAVLVAVAQRIAASLREQDTVARWGGEEFLVLAPGLSVDGLERLARRLMQAIAGTPVPLPGGGALRVTVSIGQGVFPIPPHALALRAEQAINLVDMALYLAKGQGRNRAVGIRSIAAADAAALRALEADFERGCSEGRVALSIATGPALNAAAAPGAPQSTREDLAAHSV